jgi:hypothetical protein
MGADLYRMKIENTQFVDMTTKWSLSWPKDAPPQVKPLPRQISSELQKRLDAGTIVKVKESDLTGGEIIGDDKPASEALIAGTKLTAEGKLHPDHIAAFQINAPTPARPAELADEPVQTPVATRPRPRSNATSEQRRKKRPVPAGGAVAADEPDA